MTTTQRREEPVNKEELSIEFFMTYLRQRATKLIALGQSEIEVIEEFEKRQSHSHVQDCPNTSE